MKKITIKIEGMTCSACSSGLEKYLKKQKGVLDASVNLVMSVATVSYEGVSIREIESYIKEAGFKSNGEFKGLVSSGKKEESKTKIIAFGFLTVFLMYIAMGHMLNLPALPYFDLSTNPVDYTYLLLILTVIYFIYGVDIFKSGMKNLLHGMPNMDTLVTLSVFCSLIYSIYGVIKVASGEVHFIHNLYFESACMVIYFIKLGRFLERKSHSKTKKAIEGLVQITPQKATVKQKNVEKVVSIDEISVGDIVICRPGEKVAVDGVIIKGLTHMDESFITGESKPTLKKKGDKVIAGSISFDGTVEYRAERVGKNSTISEIVTVILNATSSKNKLARLADKISSYFVPSVVGIALLTFLFHLMLGNTFSEGLGAFVTILVVACPCALGLAVPLVSVVANGMCAKKGLYLKNVESLENGRKIDTVILDKTGTMTYGKLKVHQVYSYSNKPEEELIKIVSSLEKESLHPIASAFDKENVYQVEKFKNIDGMGIYGEIKGNNYYLGNKKLLEKEKIMTIGESDYNNLVEEGASILYIVENGKVIGLIGVKDTLRENMKEVVQELKARKIEVIMLTGDNEKTAEKVSKEIGGVKVMANMTPIEKSKYVKQSVEKCKNVMMIGDGINDAAALVNATVGLSIHSGTDIASDAADVILMNDNMSHILDFIDISKRSYRIMKQNLFWAFLYNTCMIFLATGILSQMGIKMNPMIASFAMTLSSLTVVFNSLRLNKERRM